MRIAGSSAAVATGSRESGTPAIAFRRQPLGDRQHALEVLAVRHDDLRSGVAQPILERFRTEQGRERQRDGAELVRGQVGDRGLRPLREHDPDAVAALDAEPGEDARELVRAGAKLGERVLADRARVVLVHHRHPRAVVSMAVARGDRDVVDGRDRPAEAAVDVVVAVAARQERVHHGPVAYHP